jgi:iron complex outermembrane receptor protein
VNKRILIPKKLSSLMLLASISLQSPLLLAEDEVIELAPLEVKSIVDQGYIKLDEVANVGKSTVPISETPFSISVIDQSFIQDTGAKTIQDALLYSSGVNSGSYGFDTRGDWATIRGLSASVYLDGLRQIYGSYNSVRTNVYALEQVEVLKGPSSTMYGQGELGGIVNLVSKLPKEQAGGEIWAQYGTFNRKQLAVDVTGPISDDDTFLYRLVALKRDSDTQVNHVADDGYVFAPSFTWNMTDNTSVSFLFNRQENKGQVSAQFLPMTGTLVAGSQGFIDTNTFVGEPGWDRYDREKTEATLFVDHNFNENWKISYTGRYTKSSTETREHWVTIPSIPAANGTVARTIFTADNETEIFNADLRLSGEVDLGFTSHSLVVGIDGQNARWEQDNYLYGYGQGGSINIYNPQYGNLNSAILANASDRNDNQIKQVGLYLSDHIEIGSAIVSLGLRRDWAENTLLAVSGPDTTSDESETTGRIGFMYKFDNGLSPYISYAQAFTMNTGTDGTATAGTLKPTTGDQTEYGVKFLSDDKTLGVTFAYFDIEQQNRIQDGATPGGVEQVGATIDGWEMQINKRWNNFETQVSFTDINAENATTGIRLPYVAEKLFSVWNKLHLTPNLQIGAGVRYNGDNVASGGEPTVPSVTLYDAMIAYNIEQWQVILDAKNLTDERYVSWCRSNGTDCGYGERRTVTANLRYTF